MNAPLGLGSGASVRSARPAVKWAVVVLVGATLGALLGTGHETAVIVLAAAALVGALSLSPELAVGTILVSALLLLRLEYMGLLPSTARWVQELAILALVLRSFATGGVNRLVARVPRSVIASLAILVVVLTVSCTLNRLSIVGAIYGYRCYLRFIVMFIALAALDIDFRAYRRLVIFVVAVACLQVPLTVAQYLRSGGISDTNSGTLGYFGGQELLLLCLIAFALLFCAAATGRRTLLWSVLALSVLVPPLLASARATIFLAPLVALAMTSELAPELMRRHAAKVSVFAGLMVVLVLLLVATPVGTVLIGDNWLGGASAIEAYESLSGQSDAGRIVTMRAADRLISQSESTWLFGLGPGTTGGSQYSAGQVTTAAVGFVVDRNQVTNSLVEVGYVGLGAQLLVVATILSAGWRRRPSKRDPVLNEVFVSWRPIVLVFAVMFIYYCVWTATVSGAVFWLLAAVVCAYVPAAAVPGTTGERSPAGADAWRADVTATIRESRRAN